MEQIKNQKKAYLFALTAVFFWSTVPTAFKLGLKYQDNYQMVTGAAIVSTIVLALTVVMQGKIRILLKTGRQALLRSALLGLLNPALYYFILFKAYDLLPGQIAQPLNMTWPIVLVLISIPLLNQKIGWISIISMIISFAGVFVLSLQGGNLFSESSNLKGILLALFTAVLWAFYWIFNMKSKIDEVVGLLLIFAFSSIYLILGSAFREPGLPAGREAWFAAVYIGIFEMGFAFVLWLKALQLSSTTARISNLVFIAPFLNLVFVHFFLGESIYISTIFGIILVVTGIIIQNSVKYQNAGKGKDHTRD
ncbi:MAG: DMT family transporter [Bacteroidales bacterium]|nr:DMT family transporter [Bacteroidales bacterium]